MKLAFHALLSLSASGVWMAFAFGCASSTNAETAPSLEEPVVVMTLNVANGAGDRYRTEAARSLQGAFVRRVDPSFLALQEVDVGGDRSGNVDTAAAVATAAWPGFGSCAPEAPGEDGTKIARCHAGTIVFGPGFRADDRFHPEPDGAPSGLIDADESINPRGVDRGSDAFFGNALVVRAPWIVDVAYTVALPVDERGVPAPGELFERIAASPRSPEVLSALAARNAEVRGMRGIEPRAAIAVRLARAGAPSFTVFTTHLESAGTPALRAAQLDAVLALAVAERRGDPARRIVVMGDFNMPPDEGAAAMARAGLRLAAPPEGVSAIDQVWVDVATKVDVAALTPTEGVSDHVGAATASIR